MSLLGVAKVVVENAGSFRTFTVGTGDIGRNNDNNTDESAFELLPDAPTTFYFRQTTEGITPPDQPDQQTSINFRKGTSGTGEIIKSFSIAPQGTAVNFVMYGTVDGLEGSAPLVGLCCLTLTVRKTTGVGQYSENTSSANNHLGILRAVWKPSVAKLTNTNDKLCYGGASKDHGLDLDYPEFTENNAFTLEVEADSTVLVSNLIITQNLTNNSGTMNIRGRNVKQLADALLNPITYNLYSNSNFTSNASNASATRRIRIVTDNVDATEIAGGISLATTTTVNLSLTMIGQVNPKAKFNRGQTFLRAYDLVNANGELVDEVLPTEFRLGNPEIQETTVVHTGDFYNPSNSSVGWAIPTDAEASDLYYFIVTGDEGFPEPEYTDNEFSVSEFYQLDIHTQKNGVLNPDDFPNENDNEDTVFGIDRNLVHIWAHVVDDNGDPVNSSNGNSASVAIRVFAPDNQEANAVPNYDFLSQLGTAVADGGSLAGWTKRHSIAAEIPAGAWLVEGNILHDGNSVAEQQTLTYEEVDNEGGTVEETERLFHVVIELPPLVGIGEAFPIDLRAEYEGTAVELDSAPLFRFGQLVAGQDWNQEPASAMARPDADGEPNLWRTSVDGQLAGVNTFAVQVEYNGRTFNTNRNVIVKTLDSGGGGDLTQETADTRYASKNHQHAQSIVDVKGSIDHHLLAATGIIGFHEITTTRQEEAQEPSTN